MKRACTRRPRTLICIREFFPVYQQRQLMASRFCVRQFLVLSSDFHCQENGEFRVVPVHSGLVASEYGVHDVGVTIGVVHHVQFSDSGERKIRMKIKGSPILAAEVLVQIEIQILKSIRMTIVTLCSRFYIIFISMVGLHKELSATKSSSRLRPISKCEEQHY